MSSSEDRFDSLADAAGDIRQILERAPRMACLAHKDADADSLGSALGFALAMRQLGHDAIPVVPHPMPALLEYLPGYELVVTEVPEFDVLFTFDCATVGRFGDKRAMLDGGHPVVNIDHHVSNEAFGSVNLVDPRAAATGQMVYRLLRELGAPVSPSVATNLYAALFTDTGGFRHENTSEETLRLGADLVHHGVDAGWVALKCYKSRAVSQLRLEAMAVAGMIAEVDGRLIWSRVTGAMLQESGAGMHEAEGVIDQLQSIETMQIAVVFKETSPEVTQVSVRTRDQFDATDLCTPFGGGGHRRAAGAEIRGEAAGSRESVLALARTMLATP